MMTKKLLQLVQEELQKNKKKSYKLFTMKKESVEEVGIS